MVFNRRDTGLTDRTLTAPEYLIQNCTGYTGGAPLTCGLNELQRCNTLALASELIVANALGLEGMPLPAANVTVGLGCTNILATTQPTPVVASCTGILSCRGAIGLVATSTRQYCVTADI